MKYYFAKVQYTDGAARSMTLPHNEENREVLRQYVKEAQNDAEVAYIELILRDDENAEDFAFRFYDCAGYEAYIDNI